MAYLFEHAHPCLPVTFLPSDPSVVIWAERGGRVHAYDLRRAEARLRARRAEGLELEGVHMIPANRPRNAPGVVEAEEAEAAFSRLFGEDHAPALTEAQVASMTPEERHARLEKVRRDIGELGQHNWPVNEADSPSRRRAQVWALRQVHVLSNDLGLLQGKPGAAERRFVQTIRRRVRGVYVTGLCAVTAPPPPRRASPSSGTAIGPASLQTRPPPHDLVFVGIPSGVLRFRAPTAWLPDYNHGDFPAAFRAAVRAFLLCAEADTRRVRKGRRDGGGSSVGSSVSLGDMPQEVLLRVLALAATPISDWIDESAAGAKGPA